MANVEDTMFSLSVLDEKKNPKSRGGREINEDNENIDGAMFFYLLKLTCFFGNWQTSNARAGQNNFCNARP